MKFSYRVGVIFVIGVIVVSAIAVFSFIARKYFSKSNEILYMLNSIDRSENNLNYKLLKGSIYLYTNNDIVAEQIHTLQKEIQKLKNEPFFRLHYEDSYKEIVEYQKAFEKKADLIFEYLRYVIPIKNAMTYLAKGLENLPVDNKEYAREVLSAVASIYLAKSSVDIDFLKTIDLKKFERFKLTKKEEQFHKAFMINLKVFLKYYPKYRLYLQKVLNSPTKVYIKRAIDDFIAVTNKDTSLFDFLSMLMIMFIAVLIFALGVLVHKLEDEINKVKYLAQHDQLTGLFNRNKFNEDVKEYEKPVLLLFNIDRFKYINDFFGVKVGDEVLKFIAKELMDFRDRFNKAKVYRLGADDFGVLFEKDGMDLTTIKKLAYEFIEKIESAKNIIKNDNLELNISLSAGISFSEPLFENADMALKNVELNPNDKVVFFDEKFNEVVKNNVRKLNEIKKALEEDKIMAYYQPIYNRVREIVKYEMLCRVQIGEDVRSIYPYLDILKENKLYTIITKKMLFFAKEKLLKNPQLKLSINLAIEDIFDEEVTNYIFDSFGGILSRRITFEILESDINDYELLNDFIAKAKKFGIEIAIDDFGSGYSNFLRISKIDLDYLKIDGSLIKNLDTDKDARLIVETIVTFAKKRGIKSVAEFIWKEEIFEIAKDLGIDYFQGFYLGEPKPVIDEKFS
ncbi:MAG: bifunctional diguanylate cyclase/phosphodiesterase [Epsilonproteobacteria bacterium]|nr:bifunctional diguanylate cyclase/phosphodiesterase [Campylobacterota bacterium]